jgi:hypothetical protein
MSVFDEAGITHSLFSLWEDRKVIVAFTRHMGCRFCKEQVVLLERCRKEYLSDCAAGNASDSRDGSGGSGADAHAHAHIDTLIVTIGRYTDIPKFRAETGFTGEIYVDTDLLTAKCYQLLKFENGKQVLFKDFENASPSELTAGTREAALRASSALPDGGYGDADGPYSGDVFQIGGVFVLGPGNSCDFMFRSAYVGDIPDMRQVLLLLLLLLRRLRLLVLRLLLVQVRILILMQ